MALSLEIKLVVKIVLPLLPGLRELADGLDRQREALGRDPALNNRGAVWEKWKHTQATLADVRVLLARFSADFAETGTIFVSSAEACAILRACAWLRLELRAGALAAVSDEALIVEDAHLNAPTEPERLAVYSYLFLATLQEVLLPHFAYFLPRSSARPRWLDAFSARVRKLWKRPHAPAGAPPTSLPADTWRVVVRNDPVNLMNYVSALFQSLFAWPKERADQHMREVHEQGRSIVWQGAQTKAHAYAATLREWHLDAAAERDETLRPSSPPTVRTTAR